MWVLNPLYASTSGKKIYYCQANQNLSVYGKFMSVSPCVKASDHHIKKWWKLVSLDDFIDSLLWICYENDRAVL